MWKIRLNFLPSNSGWRNEDISKRLHYSVNIFFPRDSHKWILHEFKDILYLVDKSTINFKVGYDLGELIQLYLPTHSIGFKIMERTHPKPGYYPD